ncbi:4-hydroxyphenylpyruvate dioxygenase/hemolysin-like protein [Saccharomonospora marina XMU15]|uniref:3-dehydroshikimate dehydratase n=1 Tax=Saccharomonospora marina XMU15 TaxID=882083 RepID=H5X123_9PSEU|nr:sugar phosphate isomerase/epimerase and 4-hydroxyphenylpyruvate domain-containing protein [Saccharomonospora marina]EHR53082.1 4-hydroxyphenylpyruvate dioxygenase/hemolysin-like protein [Saccharomonospora marina XMU15]
MRKAIATVCLSGTLSDKLDAAAAAGFDGVEIFENDLIASPWSPRRLRDRCTELGLSVDLYQPFRDFETVDPEALRRNLRRAQRKFDLMERLGADTLLVCSSVSDDAVADADLAAEQLHMLAERAQRRGLRIAYEALAWGRHVDTWQRSWEIVRRADHPALGLCLDSFHVLSRSQQHDAASAIADLPADKLFFLQLADAPRLRMDVLQWSRHHRLFPGQGAFDLASFTGNVLAAGYRGPLSLEVFNDVFRQSAPHRAAVDAMRSLVALEESVAPRLPSPAAERVELATPVTATPPTGFAFVEVAVAGDSAASVARALAAMGFAHVGQHRSKPVQLWQQADARVLLNSDESAATAVSALGVQTSDPTRSARRAHAFLAPAVPRERGPNEAELPAVAAPDGTQVFFCRSGERGADWLGDFILSGTAPQVGARLTHVDHVALAQPFDYFDEATLFYRAVLGLDPRHDSEFAAPFGLVRNRAVSDPDGLVRIALHGTLLRRGDWSPGVPDPQHVAFATDDVFAAARAMRERGVPLLSVSDNYYDDLDARLDLDPALLARLRECQVLYDSQEGGEFFHFHTEVLGSRVFFEVVQRVGEYTGYGVANAPVRMAAHRQARHRKQAH